MFPGNSSSCGTFIVLSNSFYQFVFKCKIIYTRLPQHLRACLRGFLLNKVNLYWWLEEVCQVVIFFFYNGFPHVFVSNCMSGTRLKNKAWYWKVARSALGWCRVWLCIWKVMGVNDQWNCSLTEMFASLLALIETASITAAVNKATSQFKQPKWSELKPSTCPAYEYYRHLQPSTLTTWTQEMKIMSVAKNSSWTELSQLKLNYCYDAILNLEL